MPGQLSTHWNSTVAYNPERSLQRGPAATNEPEYKLLNLNTSSAPKVTIIGAGIVGISAAVFLQRAGFRVTVIDRLPPGQGCSFGNAGGVAFAEIVPPIRPRILLKIPGWLLDPLGPLTIRWSYLPRLLPWLLAAGRNGLPDRVRAITAARAALATHVVSDFETLLGLREPMAFSSGAIRCACSTALSSSRRRHPNAGSRRPTATR